MDSFLLLLLRALQSCCSQRRLHRCPWGSRASRWWQVSLSGQRWPPLTQTCKTYILLRYYIEDEIWTFEDSEPFAHVSWASGFHIIVSRCPMLVTRLKAVWAIQDAIQLVCFEAKNVIYQLCLTGTVKAVDHVNKDIAPKLIEKVSAVVVEHGCIFWCALPPFVISACLVRHPAQKLSVVEQEKIDQFMLELDGTENKCE